MSNKNLFHSISSNETTTTTLTSTAKSTVLIINHSAAAAAFKPFLITQEVNLILTLVITLSGLVTNLLTIYLLISVSKSTNTNQLSRKHNNNNYPSNYQSSLNNNNTNNISSSNNKSQQRLNHSNHRRNYHQNQHYSLSSSHLYMLALAISDTLFLVAHFFEDTIPSLGALELIHIVNRNSLLCKLALYVRNTARVCSSYLVVFFAYERFTAVKKPLNRLNYDSRRLTKIIIVSIFATFSLLNLYTPFVNGLRPIQKSVFECDVEVEYKSVYVYIMVPYVCISIFVPLLLICYFNISITRVLSQRKNRMLLNMVANSTTKTTTTTKQESSAQLEPITKYNLSLSARRNSGEYTKSRSSTKNNNCPSCGADVVVMNDDNGGDSRAAKMTIRVKMLEIRFEQLSQHQTSATKRTTTTNTAELEETNCQIFLEQPKSETHIKSRLNENSGKRTTLNRSIMTSNLANSLKGADRATLILLLISACFVLLNLPYVIAWANFIRSDFQPKKSTTSESMNTSYHRYSYIPFAKIFHITNFSINFYLYCLASKRFRSHLMKSFGCQRRAE